MNFTHPDYNLCTHLGERNLVITFWATSELQLVYRSANQIIQPSDRALLNRNKGKATNWWVTPKH